MDFNKKLDEAVIKFTECFAAKDQDGEWWGHDTNLGDCIKDFKKINAEIKDLIKSELLGEDKTFKCPAGHLCDNDMCCAGESARTEGYNQRGAKIKKRMGE